MAASQRVALSVIKNGGAFHEAFNLRIEVLNARNQHWCIEARHTSKNSSPPANGVPGPVAASNEAT
jgi:hypothetical protein